MKLLLEHGADVNFTIDQKRSLRSPLYCAVNNHQYEAALILLKNGADVNFGQNAPIYTSMTPLIAAVKNGDDKMVTLLVNNGADVNRWGGFPSLLPLAYACERGYTECARILIQCGSNVDSGDALSPLIVATENAHTQCVRLLLENGADVNGLICDEIFYLDTPLIVASKSGRLLVVQLLLSYGADVNKSGLQGTALNAARDEGHHEIAQLLIKHGAKEDLDIVKSTIIMSDSEDDNPDEEDAKHLAAVELAIKKKGKLNHTLSHGVLVGPARSGKSSLMQRLTGEMPSSTSPSTGVAEQVIQVGVRKAYSIALGVQDSIWFKLLYDDEAIRLMTLASHAVHDQPQQEFSLLQSQSMFSQDVSKGEFDTLDVFPVVTALRNLKTYTADLPTGYIAPMAVFKAALQHKGLEGLHQHLENSWSLYLTDTGGQIEFQELLPLLVSGPSVFFLTFCLHQDLNQQFTIEYHLTDGEKSKPYLSTLTVEEAILQTLASVASMGTFVYRGPQTKSVPLKPKVFLIGTHKDLLNPSTAQSEITKIDQHLQDVIQTTSHYREDLVEFASESQLIFTVNNLSEDDSDFQKIRSAVERVVCRSQYQISFPSHWLIFSLVL